MGHGIMFHHFHSGLHQPRSGSLSGSDLDQLLAHLSKSYTILNPKEFEEQALSGNLSDQHIVITLDDGLRSQIDVALPVLESRSISALFNIYTGIFDATPPPLELFSYFRETAFNNFDNFWEAFYLRFEHSFPELAAKYRSDYPEDYLDKFPFYSPAERKYRFIRDRVLKVQDYERIMWGLIDGMEFSVESTKKLLWMDKEQLSKLLESGHSIGLHSHSHPMTMSSLSLPEQRDEYSLNMETLTEILVSKPTMMAHPCGDYSGETLGVLQDLGISLGFRSSMTLGAYESQLEIPREDHTNLMKKMLEL